MVPLAEAGGVDDPFDTSDAVTASPQSAGLCDSHIKGRELALTDVVQYSLCNNPQTRAAWATARNRAAQLGASKATLLPSLSLQGSASHAASATGSSHSTSNRQSGTLSASYLLYDFGGRAASIDNARALLAAANASGDATVQAVFLSAAQAYFSLMSARATVEADRAAETSAREGLAAAEARYKAGAATPADRLQAKTALSQAELTRIRAEGAMRNAFATLANVMGVQPTQPLTFAPPAEARPEIKLEEDVRTLIASAQQRRPDLAAAEAQIRASEAGVDAARADGRPQITIDASGADSRAAAAGSSYVNTRSGTIALNLSFPIFTGFSTAYRKRAAEAQLESSIASRDQLAQLVALQVWQAYQNLRTEGEALRAADDLLASARESEALSLGRYRAGVGTIIDLLTAQSALANARQQHVTALYNWHAARFTLAQSIGALDLTTLRQIRDSEQ